MRATSSFLALFAAALVACQSPQPPAPAPEPARSAELAAQTCGSLAPLHVFGSLHLAGQPSQADLEELARRGVRRVVNLRAPAEFSEFDERAEVERLGMQYVHQPWNGEAQLTDEVFDTFRKLLRESSEPTLVHCGSANRVGAVWIAWRALDGGIGVDEAVAEAKRIGLKSGPYEAKAREYVARRQP